MIPGLHSTSGWMDGNYSLHMSTNNLHMSTSPDLKSKQPLRFTSQARTQTF